MKHCVITSCSFETIVQRDRMVKATKASLPDNLTGVTLKPVWGDVTTSVKVDEDGKPSYGLVVRYDKKKDADDLFILIKKQIDLIPALKGSKVSKHPCPHDEGGSCVIQEEYFV